MSSRDAKIRALKANQQRWMSERQQANDIASIRTSLSVPKEDDQNSQNSLVNTALSDDTVLNKLTEKISTRLRQEIKDDLYSLSKEDNASLAVSMENYLHGELQTHQCKICFELMMPPLYTPTLLFPCGHTFCTSCVDKNASKSKSHPKCPYCRSPIESSAVNHSLKDLIERFAKQKGAFAKNEAKHIGEVFGTNNEGKVVEEKEAKDTGGGGFAADKNKYVGEYRSCSMRYNILNNELADSKETLSTVISRKVAVKNAKSMLESEKKGVEEKMRVLEAELKLINKCLDEQGQKQAGVEDEEAEIIQQIRLVEKTMDGLGTEMEKARMLAEGCGASASELEDDAEEKM
ncbi:hypothetical protein TrST_g10672 [Triparma strigata]|uniref:RING-type domain-containing protein n=1 Tax=Triparma strigata TaxID=1606541 RepID=A0A9W7BUC9_9STRA|nr:hypothetical protein TrST_g10672 [Triparma strigata]